MATVAQAGRGTAKPLGPDRFEYAMAVGSALLLACVIVALVKGLAYGNKIPVNVWAHLGTMVIALALTPVMLLRRRGDQPHRWLGRIWVVAMMLTAIASLFVRNANNGGFSFIHILSAWVLLQVPFLWWTARTHRIALHRRGVRGLVFGALLIAGVFTFLFNRMLGVFLLG